MREHAIQNSIREFLRYNSGEFWRINVGSGFLSPNQYQAGTWFSTGVPKGFPDLIGIIPRQIEESDIGERIGQFAFVEVKTAKGKPTLEQIQFHRLLKNLGAIGGIARSIEDVERLFGDQK